MVDAKCVKPTGEEIFKVIFLTWEKQEKLTED
jgi:hypothetical protein